jgi:hypothetical protein
VSYNESPLAENPYQDSANMQVSKEINRNEFREEYIFQNEEIKRLKNQLAKLVPIPGQQQQDEAVRNHSTQVDLMANTEYQYSINVQEMLAPLNITFRYFKNKS